MLDFCQACFEVTVVWGPPQAEQRQTSECPPKETIVCEAREEPVGLHLMVYSSMILTSVCSVDHGHMGRDTERGREKFMFKKPLQLLHFPLFLSGTETDTIKLLLLYMKIKALFVVIILTRPVCCPLSF